MQRPEANFEGATSPWWGCLRDNRWVSPWTGMSWRKLHSPMLFQWGKALQRLPQHWPDGSTPSDPELTQRIEQWRAALLSSRDTVTRTDLGAGSRAHKPVGQEGKDVRRVAELAQNSLTPLADVQSLVRWLRTIRPEGRFLELGTSLGVTTAHLATSGWHVDTWEGCPDTLRLAQEGWQEVGCDAQITAKQGAFSDHLAALGDEAWDVVYLDGHHQGDATLNLAEALAPRTAVAMVVDDIAWSQDMYRAWEMLRMQDEWRVTFTWRGRGFLLKAPEMARQHLRLA